jgi:cellulose synthase/poly-beta-1,6-N-acetylglucosamine synthase-like glycosyltransferase
MNISDSLFLLGFWGIWLTLAYWMFLSLGSIRYHAQEEDDLRKLSHFKGPYPSLTILIPAHNEEMVIEATVRSVASLNYPTSSFEIVVIDDGSTDKTAHIVHQLIGEYSNLRLLNIPKGEGGKGKSRTLNYGLKHTDSELVCVFDADNTPETDCLRLLVATLVSDPTLVAVNAKVRTRNRDASWLTRFINLEFIYFQWLFQGGRWYWFRLSTLMGTGYVIYRDALEILGGFDETSLVDDTEMSLRIFRGQQRIRWIPYAVTWEQEPETLSVWLKQRVRWAMGNLMTIWKYLPDVFVYPYPLGMEIASYLLSYILFIPALIATDVVFILNITGVSHMQLQGPYSILWGLSFVIYSFHMGYFVRVEDNRLSNYVYILVSYFTYAQLFIVVLFKSASLLIKQKVLGENNQWVKTKRSKE